MNVSLVDHRIIFENESANKVHPRFWITLLSTLAALAAFEVFNYTTTSFALHNLFGSLQFGGINWNTLFIILLCCMDITGITGLFLFSDNQDHRRYDRRLFGAWLLVTGLNSWLTWRGITQAITIQQVQIGWVVDAEVLSKTLPLFITILVWLIRILLIGCISQSGYSFSKHNFADPENRYPDNESREQEEYLFNVLPHETELLINQMLPNSRDKVVNRSPTYRSSPLRYKTF